MCGRRITDPGTRSTCPTVPIQIRIPGRQNRGYVRNGNAILFAAVEIATGKVTGICKPRATWNCRYSSITSAGVPE